MVHDVYYYSVREIPEDLKKIGTAVVKTFKPRSRFFHCEYFRLKEDKEGVGKKGDIFGLEVNMRPPGGYTPDMMNYANDIDVYQIYAQMVMGNVQPYNQTRPYTCTYAARRNGVHYVHSHEEIMQKYQGHICMHEQMPAILAVAMGDDMYTARFKTEEEVLEFCSYVLQK